MEQKSVNITKIDCNAVLNKYFHNKPVKLTHFSVTPISATDINGYMGEYFHLKIRALHENKEESLQFFVKALFENQAAMVEWIKTGNMFNKEIFWYKFLDEVKSKCGMVDISFAPKYYLSRENEFIVLEDLITSGYEMRKQLDMEHLKLSFRSIAKIHATSLIFEETKSRELGRTYRLTEDYGEWLRESMFRKDTDFLGHKYIRCGVKALQALADLLPEKDFKDKLAFLADQAFEIAQPSEIFRNVWCNGDLWVKNFMFKYNSDVATECKVFDFQLQRYNPPAHDVLIMIYECTNAKERQCYLEDYLNFYYDTLTNELAKFEIDINKILNRDEFDVSCNLLIPFVKLIKAIYVSINSINPERFKKLTSNPDLYAQFTFEDRSKYVVDLYKCDETYRESMTILLEGLKDLVEHEKITVEDCWKILRKKLETTAYELLDYKVTPFTEKCGFLGEHSTLTIKIQQGNDVKALKFFVKNIPKEKGQKNFVLSSKLFYKEMKFYMNIIPELIKNGVRCVEECISGCYLARLNDVLVFDDYTPKGYVTLNSRKSYDYETMVLIIKKLAKFHASFIILEEKLSCGGQIYRMGDYYQEELVEAFYKDSKNNVAAMSAALKGTLTQIDLFPDPNSKISQELFKKRTAKAFERIAAHVAPSKKYRNTICHGDIWSNNVLLKFENNAPIDCLFVDLQTTRYNPPAHDLISFLYLSTDPKFRARYAPEILDQYHKEISKIFEDHGIDSNTVLPYEDFLASCDDEKEFAVVQCVEHFQNIIQSSEQIQDLFADQEYGRKILFEDRSPFIVKLCASDPVYKEKMRECITDLRDVCEKAVHLD